VKQTSDEALVASPIPATASRGLAPAPVAGDLHTAAVAGSPGPAAPSLRKPQRRELSYPLAALAYTWAAVCRRGR